LSPAGASSASIGIHNGVWAYTSTSGEVIASSVRADARWHQLLVSHYTARGESLFFVDGVLAGRTPERFETNRFVVGGPGASRRLDVKDGLIFRSALHAGEVAALHGGKLLQASLEVYAPLADRKFETGLPVDNRAQSLAVLALDGGRAVHVTR
jgi:hypothetical protein